jgi:electron transfer flavoprotein beta subunit
MKIAVCVKHVPCGTLRLRPDASALDRTGPGELNATDKNAIEEALRLKEGDAEVVLVTMGPAAATESLRTGLAMGADRAVLVDDAAVVGSDLVATSRVLASVLERESPDLVATSKVLAKTLEREAADLVLFGQQANDGSGAVLWAAVADRLRLPFVSQAAEIALHDGTARVTRETEFGDDVIDAQLPAVISVSDTINEPRYTSLKGMMGAKKKPLDVVTLADLGLDAGAGGDGGSQTVVRSVAKPSGRANSVKVVDDGNAAQTIVDYLVDKQLV